MGECPCVGMQHWLEIPSPYWKERYLVFSAGSNQTKETTTNEGKMRKAWKAINSKGKMEGRTWCYDHSIWWFVAKLRWFACKYQWPHWERKEDCYYSPNKIQESSIRYKSCW